MKLAFIGDLGESDVRFATDNGLDGIEVLYNGMTEADRELAAKEQQILKDSGLEVCALGLWRINFCDPDPATREANLQQLRLCIDHAADLGSSIVYTGTGVVEENDDEANVTEYLKVFPAMVEYAASKGIRLGHYTGHAASMIRSMAVWDRIKDEVPQVGLKLDPMGLIRNLQEDPVEVLYKYGDRLLHFHIKDRMDVADTWIQPAVGQGDIPWGRVMAMLYHHGYDGWISVEPHGPLWGKGGSRYTGILLAKKHIEQFMVR